MKRPLLLFSIALIAGITAAYLSNSWLFIVFTYIAISLFAVFVCLSKRKMFFIVLGMLLFYVVGSLEYRYVNETNMNKFKMYSGTDVTVAGTIASEPDIRDTRVLYVVKVQRIITEDATKEITGKILFTTLTDSGQYLYDFGREIRINGQLDIPRGKRNPGGFDYRKYLAQSGISATIFARHENVTVGTYKDKNIFVTTGLQLRNRIVAVINRSLPPQQAGLLNGMLIGYCEGLGKEVEQAFSDAGLSHIMAVSGANIAFIIMPFVLLFKKLRIGPKIANPILIGILAVFIFIVGFSPSVMRAVIMAVVILIGQMLRRETDVLTSISFAAMLLLLFNPCSLFDIGFQLSFAATLSLVLFYKNIKHMLDFKYVPGIITDVFAVTLAAQVGVIPVTVYYFNKFSIISFVSNLIVVPIVEMITILGAAMAVFGQIHLVFAQWIGYINYILLSFVLYVTKVSSSLPFAVVKLITPPLLLVGLYYLLAFFLLWYKPKVGFKLELKHYAAFSALVLLVGSVCIFMPKELEVVFIDVGEGDSTLIKTAGGKTVLIDGGGSSGKKSSQTNVGDAVVTPFLLDYGVSRLDMVIATHGHEDHIQGLSPVLQNFRVDNLIIPKTTDDKEFSKLLQLALKKKVKTSRCQEGNRIKLDPETYFDVLNPGRTEAINKSALNNSSLVLKLHYKNTAVLFTGDIESEAETWLVDTGVDIKADVLKVAHHGSEYSTGVEFLQQVKPAAAVISVGKNNFGHPSDNTVQRLMQNGIQLSRTDLDGAVILTSNGRTVRLKRTVTH